MHKRFRKEFEPLNVRKVQAWVDAGRLDAGAPIGLKELVDAGLVGKKVTHGVKLLGDGKSALTSALDLTVSRASASAIAAVEAAGGRVVTRYLTPLGVRATLKPDRFASPLRTPAPPPREMRYYLQAKNRGYLSVEVQVAEVRRRLAAGAPPAVAAAIMPVFTGGAPYDARRHLVDIQLDAPQLVAAAAAADAAKAAAAAAAGAEAGAGGGGTKRAD